MRSLYDVILCLETNFTLKVTHRRLPWGPNLARKCPNAKPIQKPSVTHGPKRTRKMAKKSSKITGMANLIPASNSMPKITIETDLRPFYKQKNDPDAPTFCYRLKSRYLLFKIPTCTFLNLKKTVKTAYFSKTVSLWKYVHRQFERIFFKCTYFKKY